MPPKRKQPSHEPDKKSSSIKGGAAKRGRKTDSVSDDSSETFSTSAELSNAKSNNNRDSKSPSRQTQRPIGGTTSRQYTFKLNDEGVLEANKVKPGYFFTWKGYSENGLRSWESKKKGGKTGTVLKVQDIKEDHTVKKYLEEIDTYSKDFTEGIVGKKKILEEFGVDPDTEVEFLYLGGWQAYFTKHSFDEDFKNKPVEVDVYPGQFSILGEYKDRRPIPRKDVPLMTQVDKLGNSNWIFKSVINKFNYSYNENSGVIEVSPYVNISMLMWINVGQQTVLDVDRLKRLKEQDEAAQWDDLAAAAAELTSQSSK